MKLQIVFILVLNLCLYAAPAKSAPRMPVIFDTDMGNDIDDALAIDMLYKYVDYRQIKLLGIMLSKEHKSSAKFLDILNVWYAHRGIPIGIIKNGPKCDGPAPNYADIVCKQKDGEGQPVFSRSLKNYRKLLFSEQLYRKILSQQPDTSVTIICTGFLTNLDRLLKTAPDKYSALSGKELVSKKVKRLIVMGGDFTAKAAPEYNIVKDIPSAQKVFSLWPSPIVISPFEVGISITYPAVSILKDFSWAKSHPVVEGYKVFDKMPYDRPTWDLTAVLYAVEGEQWFALSESGDVTIDNEGRTVFTANQKSNRRYLMVDLAKKDAVRERFVHIISTPPMVYRHAEGCL